MKCIVCTERAPYKVDGKGLTVSCGEAFKVRGIKPPKKQPKLGFCARTNVNSVKACRNTSDRFLR